MGEPPKLPTWADILAESSAFYEKMVEENMELERAYTSKSVNSWLQMQAKLIREAAGIKDGEPTKPTDPTDDLAGQPET